MVVKYTPLLFFMTTLFKSHPTLFAPPYQIKYPKLKTELNVAENSIYIYDNNHPHLFSIPQAPGVVPKIGSPGKAEKKKSLFYGSKKTLLFFLDKQPKASRCISVLSISNCA